MESRWSRPHSTAKSLPNFAKAVKPEQFQEHSLPQDRKYEFHYGKKRCETGSMCDGGESLRTWYMFYVWNTPSGFRAERIMARGGKFGWMEILKCWLTKKAAARVGILLSPEIQLVEHKVIEPGRIFQARLIYPGVKFMCRMLYAPTND